MTSFLERVTTPLLPADYLDLLDPLRSGSSLRGRIVAVHPETRDAATLVIRPGRGWRTHRPGEYLRLGVEVDGIRHWRSYSLTSAPGRADGCVTVTVKAVPGGTVSPHLVHRVSPGTLVHLEPPTGEFVLGHPAPERILFLTAGSGITPVMGMLRSLPLGDLEVAVVHSAPTPADVIFGGELRMLARHGRIRLTEIHTRTAGRLEPARLADLVGEAAGYQTWACGPNEFVDTLENHWAAMGLSETLHTERFRPAAFATGEGGSVTFTATGTTVDDDGAGSLLEAGEAAGVLMPSGCRMGICFGCVAPLRRGAVRDLRNGALTTAAEGDRVLIQTCISGAAGDCDIDL